jgi:hypothetical protein
MENDSKKKPTKKNKAAAKRQQSEERKKQKYRVSKYMIKCAKFELKITFKKI